MKNFTILIVDNDKTVANALKRVLWKEGYNILTAHSAVEALSKIETFGCHLVIADQKMPEMSGLELFDLINKRYPKIIKILITAQIDIGFKKNDLNRDYIFGFVAKPWDTEELKYLIKRGLENIN